MPVSVRRPKAVVFDILGTASKSGFLERVLFPFLKINLEPYISTHWNRRDFVRLYNKIMQQSIEFNKEEARTPIVLNHDNVSAKSALLNFINFVTENGINSPAVTQLRFKVWFEGYQQNKLKTPIYSDVPNKIRRWFAEGIKFYVYSNTWVEAQRALLKSTNHGDLTNLISGFFDNDFGSLVDPESWRRLCIEIHENPNDVLFLTKSIVEGRAAAEAGLAVVLVLTHRHNVKAISHEDRQLYPFVRTLNDLLWLEGSMMPASSSEVVVPSTRTAMSSQPGAGSQDVSAPSGTTVATATTGSQPAPSSATQATSDQTTRPTSSQTRPASSASGAPPSRSHSRASHSKPS